MCHSASLRPMLMPYREERLTALCATTSASLFLLYRLFDFALALAANSAGFLYLYLRLDSRTHDRHREFSPSEAAFRLPNSDRGFRVLQVVHNLPSAVSLWTLGVGGFLARQRAYFCLLICFAHSGFLSLSSLAYALQQRWHLLALPLFIHLLGLKSVSGLGTPHRTHVRILDKPPSQLHRRFYYGADRCL